MMRTLLRAASVLWIGAGLAACASREPHVHLEPGVQRTDASVDLERGSVTQEEEGVSVTAQAAMLPEPRGSVPRPTFWITVENHRDEPIRVTPADARLIDTFGAQHSPLPVTVDGARERYPRYALVDPEIRTYVSLHFGWPYYPFYPYRGWVVPPHYPRIRPWHFDPFWTLGIGPVWIHEIRRPRRVSPRLEVRSLDREEVIYEGANLTYVVVFPELRRTVRELRLIVPAVELLSDEGTVEALDFELIFDQWVEVPR